ncbi:MAG: arylesterase, partial [Gammaproteobacteria bacterium]
MLNRILLLLILALPFTASAQIILIVGDSLSSAYGIPVDQGWVSLLQQRLSTKNHPYRIVNASISGDTTANALARLPQALNDHKPAIVVIELGGNDGLRGLSLKAMKNNLSSMIIKAKDSGAKVMLIGVQLPPNYGPKFTDKFQAIFHELARRYKIVLQPSLVEGIGTDRNM